MMFYMNDFLIYNIETSCWTMQNIAWNELSGVLVYLIYVLQCLHAVVDTMTIIRKT